MLVPTLSYARLRLLPGLLALTAALGVASPVAAYADASSDVTATSQVSAGAQDTTQAVTGLSLRAARVQARLVTARSAYQQAIDSRALLTEHARALAEQTEIAGARAAELRRQVADQPMGGLIDTISSFVGGDASKVDQAVEAVDNEQHALSLARLAEHAVRNADRQVARTQRELADARDAAAELADEKSAQSTAREAVARAEFRDGYAVADPAQDRLNRDALAQWQEYVTGLGLAGVVPPSAHALEDPARLDEQFEPVRDRQGRAIPGVAEVERDRGGDLTVLPAETIRAVSESFSLVGLPNDTGTFDTPEYACGGLVARAWDATSYPVATTAVSQWRDLRSVRPKQRQVGDLVFLAGGATPDRVGVFLGDDLVIAVAPDNGVPAVQKFDEDASGVVLGTRRVPLPDAPGGRTTPVSCDVPVAAQAPSLVGLNGAGWTWPVDPGSYAPSTDFGVTGPLWSSGQHTGQDFAAPIGAAVYAARDGVVTVENPSWAGNLVRIDHGDGVETWYAHLSAVSVVDGQQVTAGTPVGRVGNEGNSTGPHLHFEIRIDGTPVDPMSALSAGRIGGASVTG